MVRHRAIVEMRVSATKEVCTQRTSAISYDTLGVPTEGVLLGHQGWCSEGVCAR